MKFDEAVQLVADRLGNRQGIDERVKREMRLVQETLEGGDFLPWFLLSDPQETEVTQQRLTLPPRFLRFVEDDVLVMHDGEDDSWELERADLDVVRPFEIEKEGKPSRIALGRDVMWLDRPPDKTYYLWMMYYRREPDLDSDNNRWLQDAPDWIVAETLVRMGMQFQMSGDFIRVAQQEAQQAKQRLMMASEARDHAYREYIFGGD